MGLNRGLQKFLGLPQKGEFKSSIGERKLTYMLMVTLQLVP